MTNPMLAELDEVVRLAEKATPGPWVANDGELATDLYWAGGGMVADALAEFADGLSDPPNAHFVAAAVNFLRTHHATLADMAKRLEAAERDAARAKLEAERDLLHDWLQYAFYPVGMDCCGRGQGGDCCGDGVPVYATLPDVQQAMNKRLAEIEDAIAAIDATQEGEG